MTKQRGDPGRSGARASAHVEDQVLAALASNELSGDQTREVMAHLAVCEDRRCVELYAALAAGVQAAREALYPPPSLLLRAAARALEAVRGAAEAISLRAATIDSAGSAAAASTRAVRCPTEEHGVARIAIDAGEAVELLVRNDHPETVWIQLLEDEGGAITRIYQREWPVGVQRQVRVAPDAPGRYFHLVVATRTRSAEGLEWLEADDPGQHGVVGVIPYELVVEEAAAPGGQDNA